MSYNGILGNIENSYIAAQGAQTTPINPYMLDVSKTISNVVTDGQTQINSYVNTLNNLVIPMFKVDETCDESGKPIRAELMVMYVSYDSYGKEQNRTPWMKVPRVKYQKI